MGSRLYRWTLPTGLKRNLESLQENVASHTEAFKEAVNYKLNEIRWAVKDVWKGLKNIYDYAPLLYKDRDWDHAYLFEMMVFKLKRMEQALGCCCAVRAKEKKRLKIARLLLERLEKDEYFERWDNRLFSKTGSFSEPVKSQLQDLEMFGKLFVKYSLGWWD